MASRKENGRTRFAARLGALALVAASACTATGKYDPKRFADWRIAPEKKLAGCVLVRTTPAEDAFVYRGRPSSRVGSAITLELPLGVMTREAARHVFGEVFLGGTEPPASGDAAPAACRVTISPRATRLDWRYRGLFSQVLEVSVALEARDEAGRILVERAYESGEVKVARPGDGSALAWTAQVALQALMLRAAADVRAALVDGASADAAAAPGAAPAAP